MATAAVTKRQRGERVFANLAVGEQRVLSGKRWVWGRPVYVIATRLEDGELLILAPGHRPQSALADYRLRWGIETLFAALKTRGFNLESTHFRYAERLSKLISPAGPSVLLSHAHRALATLAVPHSAQSP